MRVVLDTNVLLVSISSRSSHHWIFEALQENKYELAVTTSILNEYEEVIGRNWHPTVASSVLRALMELPNVIHTQIHFELNLIVSDPDDNKFTDCAFAANANCIVSEDNDLKILKRTDFPKINLLRITEFKELLSAVE